MTPLRKISSCVSVAAAGLFVFIAGESGVQLPRASAEPIGWIERFALAKDRDAVLAELVPGTDDFYYYHCLQFQLTGQLEKAESMLASWKADPNLLAPLSVNLRQSIEDRQRILTYSTSPDRSVEYLRQRLGVQIDHPAPAVAGVRRFPSRLDDATVALDRWLTTDAINNQNLTPQGWRVLAQNLQAKDLNDRALLEKILRNVDGRRLQNLSQLVIAEWKLRPTQQRGFGNLPVHQLLTLDQLKQVAAEVPEVALSQGYKNAYLARLRPNDDTNMAVQPLVHADYLKRLDEYASTLPPSDNGLKAAILFQRMQSDLALGQPNRETLLRYLRLPRLSPLIERFQDGPGQPSRNGFHEKFVGGEPFDLTTDFMQLAMIPAIIDERPLVRAMLEIFLKDEESTEAFDGLLKAEFLEEVFHESKLLHGVAPAQRWYEALGPLRSQRLRDRVELTLSPENPLQHSPDAPSVLKVDVKNVDSLVLRIYKINTESYYRTHDRPIDTDIDLDALLPTAERTIRYTQDAVIRHREVLSLDEIDGRGVWIVDLVGGGLRGRALIRRGDLRGVVMPSPNGTKIVAIDQNRNPIAAARFIMTGREVVADDQGAITLPPADVETMRKMIVSDGEVSVPVQLNQSAEAYSLSAGMFLDRQQLQAGQTTDLLIRPYLTMSGNPIAPETLADVAIELTAVDLDGITTKRRITDVKVDQTQHLVASLRVPPRLAELTATFSGTVTTISKNQVNRIEATRTWQVASTERGTRTSDMHLTRDGDDWIVEVLGLSGEPIRRTELAVLMTSNLRQEPIRVILQSDDDGRVVLGKLPYVESIYVQRIGMTRSFSLDRPWAQWPQALHLVAGKRSPIALPRDVQNAQNHFRLFELRTSSIYGEVSEGLSITDGMLMLPELAPGDYQLVDLDTDATVEISVTEGPVIENIALGTVRHLSLPLGGGLGITSIEKRDDGVKVRVSGGNRSTRVHVVAGRYHIDADPLNDLRLPLATLVKRSLSIPTSGYLSDLRLGDEYQYVMRRRFAAKYPGVMLPQPGLILNPWETEATDNQREQLRAGDAPRPAAPMAAEAMERKQMDAMAKSQASSQMTTYDFLADGGVVLANLETDEGGEVMIPKDLIDGLPIVQVIVTDPVSTIRRTLYLPLGKVPNRDLRLQAAIDPDRHFTFVRSVVTASPDQPIDLQSLGSAQVQVYATLGDLLDLYITLVADARLAEFRQIGRWHTLDESTKRSLYGRLACHELHLFLSIHDKPFFDAVIRPYLINKKDKQFVDHYLLEYDLARYAQSWAFGKLNALELCLLVRRKPELREIVVRRLREITSLQVDDAQRQRKLIETALAGRGLQQSTEDQRLSFGTVPASQVVDDFAVAMPSPAQPTSAPFKDRSNLGVIANAAPEGMQEAQARLLNRRSAADGMKREMVEKQMAGRDKAPGAMLQERASGAAMAFYQQLDQTKQWAESHWDRVRIAEAGANLIPINKFWLDLAQAVEEHPATMENLLLATGDRHSALAALALCGLPLKADDVSLPADGAVFKPAQRVAVITKQLAEVLGDDHQAAHQGAIVVGQTLEVPGTQDDNRDRKAASAGALEEYIAGQPYFARIVLTNTTSSRQEVDLLWQVPSGSVPLGGYQATDSQTMTIEPFQVQIVSYLFYFPQPGKFEHYPACVTADGKMAARGAKRTFHVVEAPTKVDDTSWRWIAETGDVEKIKTFLASTNLQKIDWNLVLHRLGDRTIYDVVADILETHKIDNPAVLGYALRHRDIPRIKRLLANDLSLVQSVGPVIQSDLLNVDPIERGFYEQLEYAPLVVARAHRIGDTDEILNPKLLGQYRSLLKTIAYSTQTSDDQRLALTYYLLLQNRVEEALRMFAAVQVDKVETKLQHAYLAAFLALHRSDYETAERIALAQADHPVPRWRARFETLADHLRDRRKGLSEPSNAGVEAGQSVAAVRSDDSDLALMDRQRRGEDAAAMEPSVEVKIDGRKIEIVHRNAKSAILNLYAVDPELLFSKTPFVRDDLAKMAIVKATRTQAIELVGTADGSGVRGVTQHLLDENLSRQTLMVEVIAGSARSTALYYGGNLSVYVSEGFGQVQVTDATSGTAVEKAYVKVYARHVGGEIRFYKDGYTDLRGRFDFASISNGELATVERFSILVIDPQRGATIKESARP